jgi:hypothetical protein
MMWLDGFLGFFAAMARGVGSFMGGSGLTPDGGQFMGGSGLTPDGGQFMGGSGLTPDG